MAFNLNEHAKEEQTYIVRVSFFDESDAAVTPNAGTVTWTLTDPAGNVVNSRTAVAITAASVITIVLSGDDLSIATNGKKRLLTVRAVYNSSLANNLPIAEEATFSIDPLVVVT